MKKGRPLYDIRIKNVGNEIGYNFKSKWSPELIDAKGRNHSEMELLKKIEYFLPDKEIITLFESSISFFQKQPPLPRIYNVDVTYQDEHGNTYEEKYVINLSIYEYVGYVQETTLKQVVEEIKKINLTIHALRSP